MYHAFARENLGARAYHIYLHGEETIDLLTPKPEDRRARFSCILKYILWILSVRTFITMTGIDRLAEKLR